MQNAYRNPEKRQTRFVCVCVCVLIKIIRMGWGREGVSSAASDEAAQTGANRQKQMHDAGASRSLPWLRPLLSTRRDRHMTGMDFQT